MTSSSEAIAEHLCDNITDDHLDNDVDNEAVQMHARKSFRIDTSKIECVPHSHQNSELHDLDLHVYNQETFEKGHLSFVVFVLH